MHACRGVHFIRPDRPDLEFPRLGCFRLTPYGNAAALHGRLVRSECISSNLSARCRRLNGVTTPCPVGVSWTISRDRTEILCGRGLPPVRKFRLAPAGYWR